MKIGSNTFLKIWKNSKWNNSFTVFEDCHFLIFVDFGFAKRKMNPETIFQKFVLIEFANELHFKLKWNNKFVLNEMRWDLRITRIKSWEL